ncbi:MAG: hypothetical protein R2688_07835 [Fimbriimonadaceae bacterium]
MAGVRFLFGSLLLGIVGCNPPGAPTRVFLSTEQAKVNSYVKFKDSKAINILMIGNSHANAANFLSTVQTYVEHETKKEVEVYPVFVSFLSDAVNRDDVYGLMSNASIVIFQGQKLSQSHKYIYSTNEAIKLANTAKEYGKTVLWFAEWPRKGVDETQYIENIYAGIAKESTGKIVPTGRVFDFLSNEFPKRELYSSDGNHASSDGSFFAGLTIASFCFGGFKSSDLPVPDYITEEEFNSAFGFIKSLHNTQN